MLVWMDGSEDKAPTGDEAIRARLIQDGSIRASASPTVEEVRRKVRMMLDILLESKDSDYFFSARRMYERWAALMEPEFIVKNEGPGAAVARALRIKTLAVQLSASVASRVKSALAAPTIKSMGFYSSFKLNGHNAP